MENEFDRFFEDDEDEVSYTTASLLELTNAKLQEICKEEGLPYYGTKEVLVKRIMDHKRSEMEVLDLGSSVTFVEETDDEEGVDGKRI